MFDIKKPTKTISFHKFFPAVNGFVNVEGAFKEVDDWWAEITFADSFKNGTSLWISDYKPEDQIKQLKTFIEAANKVITFAENCMTAKSIKAVVPKKKVK